jgi:hypothetical protein
LQLPQFALSEEVLTHSPLQTFSPLAHETPQVLEEQTCPLGQTRAQLPQFALSVTVLVQTPLHRV